MGQAPFQKPVHAPSVPLNLPVLGFGTDSSRGGMGRATSCGIRMIIIHLLGLAPAGCLAAPDSGPTDRQSGDCMQSSNPLRVTRYQGHAGPLQPADLVTTSNLLRGKDCDPGLGRTTFLSHAYSFALSRPLLVRLQLRLSMVNVICNRPKA
jgi:hypothetical protein